MNIFVLDYDQKQNVEYYVDKHVTKMLIETAQMLCSAYYYCEESKEVPYKLAHPNHPCSVWTRESLSNWNWLMVNGLYLYQEYMYRYGDKQHKSGNVILWCAKNKPSLKDIGITDRPLCMPDIYKTNDIVESYRNYYNGDKRELFKWTKREIPYWIKL